MTHTQTLDGLRGVPVAVRFERPEADFAVRGVSDAAAREVYVRVRSALSALGREDELRGVVTLDGAPGAAGDVAVAVAGIGADAGDVVLLGELALDGRLRPVRGVYPHVAAARDRGVPIIVPRVQAREAGVVEGATVYAAESLGDVLAHVEGGARLDVCEPTAVTPREPDELFDGQAPYVGARAQLADALGAGHWRILFVAAPGSGRTVLARDALTVLGALTAEEVLDVTAVYSVAGLIDPDVGYSGARPFRAPHHTVSVGGLVGGTRPGEVSLAHNGVLFVDEVTEFRRSALDTLWTTLGRGVAGADYPARPRLVLASATRCACGYAGSGRRQCGCTEQSRARYDKRLAEVASSFDATVEWS